MSKPIYLTTPIYYVNDKPHIGHAYTTIATDFLTKFHRLAGREAFFLTGTDEHGSKIAEAAEKAGMSEIDFCDKTVETFLSAWKNLGIEYDGFIRTTSDKHLKAVNKILEAMSKAKTDDGRDVIYIDYYEGLYCTGCEKFINEKDLKDGLCPDHLRKPEQLKEKNYFFRLTAFLPEIKRKIESGELKILPEERKREVLGLLNQDLGDFSISREKVKWGIPLSFDKSQSAYVWVDALTNYISAIGYADDQSTFDKWWNSAEVVHMMAKDILKFHCLFWPAMLTAAGIKLPDTIYLHGFFTVDGTKMSKTLGNMIDPNDMIKEFGADATRYLLLTQYPFGIDGDIQAKRFVTQYNSDLANDLGNLVSRVVKMVESNFEGKLPEPSKELPGIEKLMELSENLADKAYNHVNYFRPDKAIAEAMTLVKFTNKFFNDIAPWKLAKEGKKEQMGAVLYACCEVIRIVSIILFPIMPNKIREIRSIFKLDDSSLSLDSARTFFELTPGTEIKLGDSIFPRLKPVKEDVAAKKKVKDETGTGLIEFKDFQKVELKVAEVLKAEKVEGTDKLLKLQIDIGTETRQLVAGVAEYYTPEKIIGQKIIVVTNLSPAVIKGVESQGMLLAAKNGKKLSLITTDPSLPPGSKVS